MKTIINVSLVFIFLSTFSCTSDSIGPRGPEGPQGEQGPQGESGFVFEYDNIDFTSPDFEALLPYPDDFEPLESDVALVYLLWDVVEVDGKDTEVWRPLPQSILTENGLLQYNYDFTMFDARLFLEAEFDLSTLDALDTDDWVARVVIVPGNFWNSSRISNGQIEYNDLKELLELPDLPTPNSKISRR